MTGRIFTALLVLTGGLLLGAFVPLGLEMDHQHWRDYRTSTLAIAHTIAAAAEEKVVDHEASGQLTATLAALRKEDEGGKDMTVAVVDRTGRVVAGSAGLYRADRVAPGLAGASNVIEAAESLLAVVPIVGHTDIAGAVLLSRPTGPVERRVHRLWELLAVVAAAAVLAAAILASALARWVGRPLRRLESAAEALGSGELGARAVPPKKPAEVRQVTERFNVMAARLETLIYDHRAVIADVSHQLRTPLAALRLRMELLSSDARDTADVQAEVEGALDELGRLSRLVDGLLAVARAENTSTAPAPVALGETLRERAEAWRPVAAERGVRLTVRVQGEPIALIGPGNMEQILDNLIDNALTAGPESVTLAAAPGRDGVRVTIADDGPGMTERDMAEAFRRFRTDRARGTGLGLAIVHRLVTADGGAIRLTTTPGGGLTVLLDLPEPPA